MAITGFDGVIAGGQPPQFMFKGLSGTLVAGRPFTPIYQAGIPGPAVANSAGVAGAALTSYAGLIPFTNPGAGNSYLARLTGENSAIPGQWQLMDRLWHNSGLSVTLTSSQTVNSAALPARDRNGSTNGDGVYCALEISGATGAGTPTITLGYTNSAGTSGRTATLINATAASSAAGTFYVFALQAGDVGIRSIQSYQQSATWTSGTLHLVMFRFLGEVPVGTSGGAAGPLELALPRLYDNTCLQPVFVSGSTTTGLLSGSFTVTQG